MKNFYLLFFILCVKLLHAQTDATQYNLAIKTLNERGEVYFSFELNDQALLEELSQSLSIDNIEGNTVYAYSNYRGFNNFVKKGLVYTILTSPSLLAEARMTDSPEQVFTWDYYPTYTAYESIMQQFATNYPAICKLITITTLNSGRKILALRISDNVNIEENEPEFLYSSSIHGDETTGYILMLHLADSLLSAYGLNTRITNLVDNTDIVICPLANPDGTYKGGNNSVNGATRFNANNIDLNRNYPDPRAGAHPDQNPWQPETEAFMNFASANSFTMASNFHGGTEVINYPWDTWRSNQKVTADNQWWIYTSRQYVDTVHLYSPTSYYNGFDNGITFGGDWYVITGGRQDYMNYFQHCRESTNEISDVKLLPASQLQSHWKWNRRSLLNYIEQTGYGLHGLVTDSVTGQPLYAKIFIQGFDKDSSYIYTDPQVGDYHRLLKGGTYTVTYTASGYYPKSYQVSVADMQKLIQNVQLYDGRLATNFSASFTQVAVDQQVHFTDKSVGQPLTWNWTFEGGNPATSTQQNPVITYETPGAYSVKLVVTRAGSIDSLVRDDYITVNPWYFMNNKTYTVCNGKFYDSGGPLAPYSVYENSTITFLPDQPALKLKAEFNSLDIEPGGNGCNTDALLVYNGAAASGSPIATICGTSLPGAIYATTASGALTFKFNSDGLNNFSGWEITLSCYSDVGNDENFEDKIVLFPNPVSDRYLHIETQKPIESLIISNITGQVIYKSDKITTKTTLTCNWPSGIYIVHFFIDGKWIYKKIQVINN